MNGKEWAEIAATIQARWPAQTLSFETLEQWGRDLEDLDGRQVAATVDVLYREGREFAPNGGVIRKRLVQLVLDPPEWGEVLEQLREIEMAPESRAYEHDPDGEPGEITLDRPREAILQRAHPMVVAFHEHLGTQVREGVGVDTLRQLTQEGSNEARLREKWKGFRQTAERRMSYIGIEAADLPALERAATSGIPRSAGEVFGALKQDIARTPPRQLPESTDE